jgi:polar amino acid transport system permease protein
VPGWDWDAFRRYLFNGFLLQGVWTTLWLAVVCMGIGLSLGFISAFMRMSRISALRLLGETYVWLIRGTPLLVQLIIIYTGLPQLGIRLTVIQSAIVGLSINEGAYLSEIVRAGILSVPQGQLDAARALGMTYVTAMRLIILPQAARVIIPPLGNNFNGLLKTTSITSVISVEELLRRSQMLIQLEFRVLEIFCVAATYYLALTTLWGLVQRRLEEHFGKSFSPREGIGSAVTSGRGWVRALTRMSSSLVGKSVYEQDLR